MRTITIQLPDYLIEELPEEESSIYEILKLGLKQLKIEKAIARYQKKLISKHHLKEYLEEIKRRRDIGISSRVCQKLIEALEEGVL